MPSPIEVSRSPANVSWSPLEDVPVLRRRGSLRHTEAALASGAATLGFLGGSITQGISANWTEPVISWFQNQFPDVRFVVENAAIGGTGSNLAVFRAEKHIIDRNCDLVFVEYVANDDPRNPSTAAAREGLLRKLLRAGIDVVLVYTYRQTMYEDMMNGRVPSGVAGYETLAEHYGVSSTWAGLYAFREVAAGAMAWDVWLPDGLHPGERGSLSYGQSVISLLRDLLTCSEARQPAESSAATGRLPDPLDHRHWETAHVLSFDEVSTSRHWSLRRWPYWPWTDQVLYTSAVGAELEFSFTGGGIAVGLDTGKLGAAIEACIDDGEINRVIPPVVEWWPDRGIYQLALLADNLARGRHHVRLRVVHGDQPLHRGTRCAVALLGVLP